MTVIYVNLADATDPQDADRRTYRQINAARSHAFSLGDLIEDTESGARVFVAMLTRDCDQTPMYSVSCEPIDRPLEAYADWERAKWSHGWDESGCVIVRARDAEG